jgi:acetylornithine deacetylase/succinyl-diaminopimelate desuccinylase-like protein
MDKSLENLPAFAEQIRKFQEILITNIVLTGQIPSPTFEEAQRARFVMDRLAEFQVDECAADSFGNPVAVIRGASRAKPPIFIIAHLDTFVHRDVDHNYTVTDRTIHGPGVSDNSAGVGVMISLPEIFRRLDIRFESDIVLAAVKETIGKGNLKGIRRLLSTWPGSIRGGICLETVEIGRLNYFSDGMVRAEIDCTINIGEGIEHQFNPNAILVINEIINQILELRLPQKPRAHIVIGKITGGFNHGKIATEATLGLEIRSDSDDMVKEIRREITDIVEEINQEYGVELHFRQISNLAATRLRFNHPLVKSAGTIIRRLGLEPFSESTESALTILLSRDIPALTLGLTRGDNFHQETAMIEIDPLFKGIAQVIGVLKAIDKGACDERRVAEK